jgi:trehalose 6-phosphate phosphatase
MRHLLNHWNQICRRLRSAPKIALFLDFDGTLARLRARPDQVSLDGSVKQALAALAQSPRFRVWVISGRRQADVRARIRIPGIRYLGLHGWEGRREGRRREWQPRTLAEETRRDLRCLLSRLKLALADVPGLWIEDKEHAFAVHYADVAEPDVVRARSILDRATAPYSEHFRIDSGKSVWELLPRELEDKGAAVKQQLALLGGRSLAVYLGDDQVDEPAFAALRDGVTVYVGPPCRSRARYRLSGIAEVQTFLHRLRTEFT